MTLLPSTRAPLSVYERGRVELRHIIIRSICWPALILAVLMLTLAPGRKRS